MKMKRTILMACVALAILFTVVLLIRAKGVFGFAGVEIIIPAKDQAILTDTWTPTPEQAADALNAVHALMAHPRGLNEWQQDAITRMRTEGATYCVQFIGAHHKDKKVILCNFFSARRANDDFPHWREQKVVVFDGGIWYWQILYDVQSGKCLYFSPNGVA